MPSPDHVIPCAFDEVSAVRRRLRSLARRKVALPVREEIKDVLMEVDMAFHLLRSWVRPAAS